MYFHENNNLFWWFVESQHNDNVGDVVLFQNGEGNQAEDSKAKAETPNRQFQSVFIQDNGNDICAVDGHNYPHINYFALNVKGVETLLKKLKNNKAW